MAFDCSFNSFQRISPSSIKSPSDPCLALNEMLKTFLVSVPSMTNKNPSRSPYMTRASLSNCRPRSVAMLYKYSGFMFPPSFSGKLELFPIQFHSTIGEAKRTYTKVYILFSIVLHSVLFLDTNAKCVDFKLENLTI